MLASGNGHHDIVRTLLEGGADVNDKDKVRNQIVIILLTTLMMVMMMIVLMIM